MYQSKVSCQIILHDHLTNWLHQDVSVIQCQEKRLILCFVILIMLFTVEVCEHYCFLVVLLLLSL